MGSLQLVSPGMQFDLPVDDQLLDAMENQLHQWNQTLKEEALHRSALQQKISAQISGMETKISAAFDDIRFQLQKLSSNRFGSPHLNHANISLTEISNTSVAMPGSVFDEIEAVQQLLEEPLVEDDETVGGDKIEEWSPQLQILATVETEEDEDEKVDASGIEIKDNYLGIHFVQDFQRKNMNWLRCITNSSEAPTRKDGIGVICFLLKCETDTLAKGDWRCSRFDIFNLGPCLHSSVDVLIHMCESSSEASVCRQLFDEMLEPDSGGNESIYVAVRLLKVSKSHQKCRRLADSTFATEELWWQAIEYARLDHSSTTLFNCSKILAASSRGHTTLVASEQHSGARMGATCEDEFSFPSKNSFAYAQDPKTSKQVHDNVHGNIYLDDLALAFVDSEEFQRLRGLKQFGMAHLVYPGAVHSRFEHSLGVYWLAGLLHDIVHGPFSHLFEREFLPKVLPGSERSHEQLSADMVDTEDTKDTEEKVEKELIEEALIFMQEMASDDFYPNRFAFNTLIGGLCRVGHVTHTLEIFDSMLQEGIDSDVFTYNTMISGLWKRGEIQEAMAVLNQLLSRDCSLSSVTYNVIISTLCKENHVAEVTELARSLTSKGILPDVSMSNSLIQGLCLTSNFTMAVELFFEIQTKGCQPDESTYNILIDCLCRKGKLDGALSLLKDIEVHFRALVSQLLRGQGIIINEKYEEEIDIVTIIAWQAAKFLKSDTRRGGSMDPCDYLTVPLLIIAEDISWAGKSSMLTALFRMKVGLCPNFVEVVEFLKKPDRSIAIGAHIPKGVLLVGLPGTGQTLLAKVIAGEAGVPFFSISGFEFVEMFVSAGASKVCDLFTKAKERVVVKVLRFEQGKSCCGFAAIATVAGSIADYHDKMSVLEGCKVFLASVTLRLKTMFLSFDPRGRGSFEGGSNVMTHVRVNGDDDSRKRKSTLVGARVGENNFIEEEGKNLWLNLGIECSVERLGDGEEMRSIDLTVKTSHKCSSHLKKWVFIKNVFYVIWILALYSFF